jgi:hypothetical protein
VAAFISVGGFFFGQMERVRIKRICGITSPMTAGLPRRWGTGQISRLSLQFGRVYAYGTYLREVVVMSTLRERVDRLLETWRGLNAGSRADLCAGQELDEH